MNHSKGLIFLSVFIILFLYYSISLGEENIWLLFAREPNEAHYHQCQDLINDSLAGPYEEYQSPAFTSLMADRALGELLDLTETGSIYAAHLSFQIYSLFYPGYPNILEHINISLGNFLKKDPESFLKLLKTYVLKKKNDVYYDLNGMLGNYGDEFVDDSAKQLKETEERISVLESVNQTDLIDIQKKCLEYLYQKRESYRETLQKK